MARCRQCKATFQPSLPLQRVCSWQCAAVYAGTERARRAAAAARREELRAYRASRKSVSQATREAQAAFNAWVRARDAGEGCISCGSTPEQKPGGTMDAGHYRSTGAAPALRFHEDNCHAQCVRCNRDLSGNSVAYRQRLLERIGAERLAWLEGPHEPKRYRVAELDEITREYRRKLRDLKIHREHEKP